MKWNAFNLVTPGIDRTKELLFPFKLKNWMKLGFVSMFSRGIGGNYNTSNFSIPQSSDKGSITGNAVSEIGKYSFPAAPIIALAVFAALVVGLIMNFITSVFTFMFIDDLAEKKYEIKKPWKKNLSKGVSLFWFKIIVGIISLIVIAIIFLPFIIPLIQHGWNIGSYMTTGEIVTRAIFCGSFLILWIVLVSLFMLFVKDFSLVDMYKDNTGITRAVKNTFSKIRRQKTESFVYFIAVVIAAIVIGILGAIAGLVTLLICLLIAAVIGAPVFIPIYLIAGLDLSFWIVLGIYIFIWILILAYAVNVAILPLTCFRRYFSILAYEKMFKKRVL